MNVTIDTNCFNIIDDPKLDPIFELADSDKIRKTVGYDIVSGQKITRLAKKPKKKTTKRKTFKKSISKRKILRKKISKNIWNMTFDDL